MPTFKIVTTTTSYLHIDLEDESDVEAWEDAVGEDGEIDAEKLAEMLSDDMTNPHDDLDVEGDNQETTATLLSKEEVAKLFSEQ